MTIKLSESTKPLRQFLAKEAEKREVPKCTPTSSSWGETLGGLAVVIYSQPTNIPLWPDMVIGGIKQIRRSCNSDAAVRTNLKRHAFSGILIAGPNQQYYLNIEIPGELLAREA